MAGKINVDLAWSRLLLVSTTQAIRQRTKEFSKRYGNAGCIIIPKRPPTLDNVFNPHHHAPKRLHHRIQQTRTNRPEECDETGYRSHCPYQASGKKVAEKIYSSHKEINDGKEIVIPFHFLRPCLGCIHRPGPPKPDPFVCHSLIRSIPFSFP
ncbi:hypothetical protein N657DRAFT_211792 [Parathielavia appendiculata]|uniref:Uncharacterized protein n=1 Tax=Parathielavia appendiculata TaxID=2587402 RepID=A0AAN6U6N8_9PEZI|nr:hypothetical protein N657DRAFT_211792 [Parathielavia appendiculata]